MQQPVDALLQFDERTVIGQVADTALDQAAFRISFGDIFPRILLGLFHAQRDLLLFLVDSQHDDVDLVADLHQFVGMTDSFGP